MEIKLEKIIQVSKFQKGNNISIEKLERKFTQVLKENVERKSLLKSFYTVIWLKF